MALALEPKSLLGVLNGLSRRLYFDDESMTNEFLSEQIGFQGSPDEFSALSKRYEGLLSAMATANMEFSQLQAFLGSQMKRRENPLSEQDAAVFQKFWKTQKAKIHESLVRRSCGDGRLSEVSWRIDVKSKARHVDQINQPTAIVELQIDSATEKQQEILCFEMDEEHAREMLHHVQDIQHCIEQFTK